MMYFGTRLIGWFIPSSRGGVLTGMTRMIYHGQNPSKTTLSPHVTRGITWLTRGAAGRLCPRPLLEHDLSPTPSYTHYVDLKVMTTCTNASTSAMLCSSGRHDPITRQLCLRPSPPLRIRTKGTQLLLHQAFGISVHPAAIRDLVHIRLTCVLYHPEHGSLNSSS